MPAAWVGAAASVYGALNSGGGGGTVGPNNTYIPYNQGGMDTSFNQNYNAYGNTISGENQATSPYNASMFQSQMNNPYAPGYQQAAGQAGQMYGQQAGAAMGAANQSFSAANQAYQSAFDPRSAQYAQNVQQLQDNTRAGEYARGIQMSPYGAAVEGNVMQNFQNDWQNQQLARQAQGLQTMNQANQAGSGLSNTAGQMQLSSGQIPYGANQAIYGGQQQAMTNYAANNQPYLQGLQQLQSNALSYNNYGQGASNQAFNQGMQSNQMNQQAIGQLGQGVGQAIGAWNASNTNNPANQSYWSGGFSGNAANGYNQPGFGSALNQNYSLPSGSAGWGME